MFLRYCTSQTYPIWLYIINAQLEGLSKWGPVQTVMVAEGRYAEDVGGLVKSLRRRGFTRQAQHPRIAGIVVERDNRLAKVAVAPERLEQPYRCCLALAIVPNCSQ